MSASTPRPASASSNSADLGGPIEAKVEGRLRAFMGKRIAFTGGSGKIGRTVVPYLIERGHKVLNLDLKPLDAPEVNTVLVDLADSGETFDALSMHFGFDDLRRGGGPAPLDAVVHFAAIPRILMRPDNAMFAANVLSTYNVIEADNESWRSQGGHRLEHHGLWRLLRGGRPGLHQFSVDEDYDADPTDSYGLSKLLGEKERSIVRFSHRCRHLCASDRRGDRTRRL